MELKKWSHCDTKVTGLKNSPDDNDLTEDERYQKKFGRSGRYSSTFMQETKMIILQHECVWNSNLFTRKYI